MVRTLDTRSQILSAPSPGRIVSADNIVLEGLGVTTKANMSSVAEPSGSSSVALRSMGTLWFAKGSQTGVKVLLT